MAEPKFYLHFDCSRYRDRMRGGGAAVLVRTFSEQCWFSCCYVVAVAVDEVNVVVVVRVRVILLFLLFVVLVLLVMLLISYNRMRRTAAAVVRTFSGQRCDRQQDGLRTMDSGHHKHHTTTITRISLHHPNFLFLPPIPPPPLYKQNRQKLLLKVPLLKTSLHRGVLALSLTLSSLCMFFVARIFSIIVWCLQIYSFVCFCY